jgi:CheY-like chemotaxis protein/glycine cleavage system H lipoate-binding protein
MVVASIVITTIVVFIVVDLLLRLILTRVRSARTRKEREHALDIGLSLDVSEEAPTLKRVALDEPKARILAVDDEAVILDSFRKMLVLGGYSIDTVESGPEALGLIRKHDYDFVFTDLKMPGMDGIEVTKSVRHLRPDIDVIVITGYGTIESAVETVQHGAMDYVQKPFTEDELLDFVNQAVIKRQAHMEQRMRHKIRLVHAGTRESKSRFELNVPAGVFVSPQHAWAKLEMNGTVRIGIDDLLRKLFGPVGEVELPEHGKKVRKGEILFSIDYGDCTLAVPAPLSGRVVTANTEHRDHPEWLAVKPFELGWICALEPADLGGELPGLKVGAEAVTWYQEELDRFSELAARLHREDEPGDEAADEPIASRPESTRLLEEFTKPFLPA